MWYIARMQANRRRIFPQALRLPAEFRLYGLGLREPMRAGMVRRAQGGKHYLLICFHTPFHLGEAAHPAHRVAVLPPGVAHAYGHPDQAWTHSWLALEGAWVERIFRSLKVPAGTALPADPAGSEHYLAGLSREAGSAFRPDAAILRGLLECWMREVLRSAHGPGPRSSAPPEYQELRRALAESIGVRTSLDEWARRLHVSRWHLCREFKRYFGQPPLEYVQVLRMQHAAHLLRDPHLRIGEIARACGHEDPYHFSKQFRKHFGLSPRAMRKQAWAT
ncbi:MAG: hypothetical protein AMXMBFR7_10160 [Planctomycetota bacterium]